MDRYREQREQDKFRDNGSGATIVAVGNSDGTPIGGSAGQATVSILSLPTVSVGVMPAITLGSPTVYQGTTPWVTGLLSLPTISIGTMPAITLGSPTVYQGTTPWVVGLSSLPTISIGNTPTVTANAGTNLNTSALALEAGNLATLAGAISSSVAQTNLKQVNGVTTQTGLGTAGTGSQRVAVASDSSIVLATGTAALGDVNLAPLARGGWSVSSQTALTAMATVSAAAGKFGGYMFMNLNTAPAYVQIFDYVAASAPSIGVSTPTFVVPLPANGTAANGIAAHLEIANGVAVTNGIRAVATTTATGGTLVSTGLTGYVLYK